MGERVSQAEFARRVGVSRQRVNTLVKKGRLVLHGKHLDYEESLEALAFDDPTQPKKMELGEERIETPNSRTPSYRDAKTMREVYLAQMAKLRFDEARGVLVSKNAVETEAFNLARVVRDSLLALPSRLREVLADEKSPKKVHAILEREVRTVIAELEAIDVG